MVNRRRLLLGSSIVATFLSKTQARADLWGAQLTYPDGSHWWWADNGTHTYCKGSGLSTSEFAFIEDAMDHLDAVTDMTTSLSSSCSSSTDVLFADGVLGYYGVTWCNIAASSTKCDRFITEIDYAFHAGLSDPDKELQQTTCHEIGHTTGLEHDTSDGANSCMMSDSVPSPYHAWYSGHHKDHINSRY